MYGHDNRLNGWHRKQLNYQCPVTIRFRPRHTKIIESRNYYVDKSGSDTYYRANAFWPNSDKLVRSFLNCDVKNGQQNERHYWMGPVIRLIDADLAQGAAISNSTLFDLYGIKATVTGKLALRGIKANDPIFPDYSP